MYVYVCMFICIYISAAYIYTHTHTHTHTHVQIQIKGRYVWDQSNHQRRISLTREKKTRFVRYVSGWFSLVK
jgi:hypothetical protein